VQDPEPSSVSDSMTEAVEAPAVTSIVRLGTTPTRPADNESVVVDAFEAHASRLKAFALAAVRDGNAADDLVQESYLRLVREVRDGRVPDDVAAWLFRVCGNLIISRGRRVGVADRMRSLLVDRGNAVSAETRAIRAEETTAVRRALTELPIDARVALLMAAEGYSAAEIGLAIDRTANATSTYICRARIRLREILATAEAGR
jgi:RNA polymerase sigma factor (sigma-70 family)